MNPFHIQCTTCHRMLIVRKESAIGQILPCPKCGSLVLIEAPPNTLGQPAAKARTPAKSADAPARSAALDELHVDAVLAAADPQTADTVPDSVEGPVNKTPSAEHPDLPHFAPTPAAAREDWVSTETQLLKRWLFIGAAAVAGVIFMIILGGLWLSPQNDPRSNLAQKTTEKKITQTAGEDTREQPAPATADLTATAANTVSAAEPVATTETADVEPTGPENGVAAPEGTATSDAGESTEITADEATPSSAPDSGAPETENSAITADSTTDAATDDEPAPSGALTAREALRQFEGMLADTTFDHSLRPADSRFDLIPTPSVTHDLSAALPRPIRPNPNVDALLKTRLASVEFKDVPLSRFLKFVSDFTSLPVTVDPYVLSSVGLEASVPVNVSGTNQEISELLRVALEPLELKYDVAGKHIVIVAQASTDEGLDVREYEVFDIVGDDVTETQALVEVITALIAPASWRERGGKATISIVKDRMQVAQTPEAHYEIQMLCERLRIARGLRTQGDVPPHFHELTPRVALALPKLEQRMTVSYLVPTRLTEILQYLADTAEIQVVVDWRALEEVGHTPESLAKLEVNEQTLSQTLQSLLGPMELSFLVVDDQTLQITSAKLAFQKPDVELFRLTGAAVEDGGQKILDGVRSILGDSFAAQRGPSGLRFDGHSHSLIVAAPQYQIAAIARLIEQSSTASSADTQPERPMEEPVDEKAIEP